MCCLSRDLVFSPNDLIASLKRHLENAADMLLACADSHDDNDDLEILSTWCNEWLRDKALPELMDLGRKAESRKIGERDMRVLKEAFDSAHEVLAIGLQRVRSDKSYEAFQYLLNWMTEIPHAVSCLMRKVLDSAKSSGHGSAELG